MSNSIQKQLKNHSSILNKIVKKDGAQKGADYILQIVDANDFGDKINNKLSLEYDKLVEIAKITPKKSAEKYDYFQRKMRIRLDDLRDNASPKAAIDYIRLLLSIYNFTPKNVKMLKSQQDILETELKTQADAQKLRHKEAKELARNTAKTAGQIHDNQTAKYKTEASAQSFINGLASDFDCIENMRSNDPEILKQTYYFYAEKWYRLPEYGGDKTIKFNTWAKKTFNLADKIGKDNHGKDTLIKSADEVFEAFRQMLSNRRRKGAALLGFQSTSKKVNDAYIAKKEAAESGGGLPDAPNPLKPSPFSLIVGKIADGKYTITDAEAFKAIDFLKSSIKDTGLLENLVDKITAWSGQLEEMQDSEMVMAK